MASVAAAPTPRAGTPRLQHVEIGSQQVAFVMRDGQGRAVHIEAECELPSPAAQVWEVLTDYNHLAHFIPFLTDSRVLEQAPGGVRLLRQDGRVGMLGIFRRFTVTFRVTERPMSDIWFEPVEGDFRQFTGTWHLEPRGGGTRIRHVVDVEPGWFAPRWAIRVLAQHVMLRSFAAVINRCLSGTDAAAAGTG